MTKEGVRPESAAGARGRGPLRLLSIAAPLAGLAALYPLRLVLLRLWPSLVADAAVGLLMVGGVLAVSWIIFRIIDRQDRRLARQHAELERRFATERRLRAQLEALHEAALTIASARTPDQILQHLVDLARALIGARYAALGVLGPQGAIDAFYTAGIAPELRARLGPPPQGHGLLSVVLTEGTALRVPDIAADPRAMGFPPGHPPMRSLLAVPVAHQGHVVGNLYLADKRVDHLADQGAGTWPGAETGTAADQRTVEVFSPEDERLLTLLAGHAAVVIQNARLAEQVRGLAIVAERDRIAKDLHDGVIQALYATSLELESAAEDVDLDPPAAQQRIAQTLERLDAVVRDMRGYILGLQPAGTAGQTLPEALAALLAETRAHTLLQTDLQVAGAEVGTLPHALSQELLQIAREAVANAVRHAHAGTLSITLDAAAAAAHLRIADNGVGFDPQQPSPAGHYGLRNLRERARALGGVLSVQSAPGRGTTIDVRVPLRNPAREGEEAHAHA